MNTSILTVALAGALLAGQNGTSTWQTSYSKAQQIGSEQKKPLAVVFGAGANGWAKVVRDAEPSQEVTQMLTSKYVCVYIDTTSPAGKKVAENFGIIGGSGLVISDRGCTLQAFWHQGNLTNQNMVRFLEKYADPQVVVRGTETASTTRTSYYPAAEPEGGTVSAPASSSYCPSCNNVRGRR